VRVGLHCRLVAGVRVLRESERTFLVSEQPLTVVEVTDRGRALLERSRCTTVLAGLSPTELRFLRRLRELGLVELRPVPEEPPPMVSVVVPVRDRPEQLADCLRSLEGLGHPRDRLQVIVVDDGSAVPVAERAGIRVVRADRPSGPAGTRHMAAT